MRKVFLALAALPLLAACNSQTVPSVSPVVTAVVGVLPEQVQQTAVSVCGFLPAAETAASLIAAFGGPSVPGIATQIAAEICNAVNKRTYSRSGRPITPKLRGVVVRGSFVR